MPENQDRITQITKIKKKVGDSRIDRMMAEYVTIVDGRETAVLGDAEIAEAIAVRYGIRVSSVFIWRYRLKRNIKSYHGHGGYRPNFNRDGRPPKFTDDDLSRMMADFVFTEVKSEKKITRQTDAVIAEAIREKHGVDISEDMIRRYRMKHGITARHGKHGGKRPGSGRPKDDYIPPDRKARNTHKLTISDYSLVRTCPNAYEFRQGQWDERKGQYDRLPRYVPKYRQDGLKSYTPVIPFPDRYSKAQEYGALTGY